VSIIAAYIQLENSKLRAMKNDPNTRYRVSGPETSWILLATIGGFSRESVGILVSSTNTWRENLDLISNCS
jgi:hypothetical protein